MNVAMFVSGLFTVLTHFMADKLGRRTVLLIASPIGIIGTLLGLLFNSLVSITIANTLMSIADGTIFSMNFIYLNETLVDPLRSKSSGLKTFFLSLGGLVFTILFIFLKNYKDLYLTNLICSIAICIVALFCDESPLFLLNTKKFKSLQKVMLRILDTNIEKKSVNIIRRNICKKKSKF